MKRILEIDVGCCCLHSHFSDLISTRDFLHFPESGVELADEVMLPSGVVVPHEALLHTEKILFTIMPYTVSVCAPLPFKAPHLQLSLVVTAAE